VTRQIDAAQYALVVAEKLRPAAFPRSGRYEARWVLEHQMGPNVLWLTESLSTRLELRPGMRVLDLGCGKALSSIFLAREFGVQVWATDLWVAASDNGRRVREAGVERLVYPVHAEAHALPFAAGFFDVIVSLDAYHYFGTDDLYLGTHLAPLVGVGGQLGIVVPGLVQEFDGDPPAPLAPQWREGWDLWSFHSPAWWRRHWAKTGLVAVEVAELMPDGWRHWLAWDEALFDLGYVAEPRWIALLRTDQGQNLGFTQLVARRTSEIVSSASTTPRMTS